MGSATGFSAPGPFERPSQEAHPPARGRPGAGGTGCPDWLASKQKTAVGTAVQGMVWAQEPEPGAIAMAEPGFKA